MKRLLPILALLCASATYADQPLPPTSFTGGGNITSANAACNVGNCVLITLPSVATTLTVGVTGTFSATLKVEESQDGGRTWTSAGSDITSTGTTIFTVTAFTNFRVRASALVSGNAGVNLLAGPTGGGGGGGGGGGTCPAGAATDIQFSNGTNCDSTHAFAFDKTTNSLTLVPSIAPLGASLEVAGDSSGTFGNDFFVSGATAGNGGTSVYLTNTSFIPSSPILHFYGLGAPVVPFVSGITSFGTNGGGTPFTTAGFWGVGMDGKDADGEIANGQTLFGIVGGTAMRKAVGHTVAYQSALAAFGPTSDIGFTAAPVETSANSYGLDVYDQRGTSTTETAGIRIQSQTAPVSGTKWSIKADSGSGIANFGDGIDDGTLTSGKCVQASTNGRLTSSATGCANSTFSISFQIDGGGLVPATGIYGQYSLPANATVTGWVITADQSCSAVVDVLRSTFSGFPTTSSIAGSDKPTLSSVQKNSDFTLTGWGSTALNGGNPGDEIQINLNSVTSCTRINLAIYVTVP